MISIKNLRKSFGKNDVLKGLNLEIAPGEITFIVGKSGSGKSVLLKLIMGLLKADEGEVIMNNNDMGSLEGSALYEALINVGMIFQMGALFDSMTIGENVTFYLENHGMIGGEPIDRSTIRERGEAALEQVGLAGTYNKFPSELSGGMKKRAALVRSMIFKPEYTFYDEPTTGLDPITALIIAELMLEQQKQQNGTVVVVSHDIWTTLQCADRIALIEDGVIEVYDTPLNFMQTENESINQFRRMIGNDLSIIKNQDK